MTYTSEAAKQQLLESLASATVEMGDALTCVGEAHEQLDERSAERLEQALFRPLQRAYALAQRALLDFAARSGLPRASIGSQTRGAPSHGARGFIEEAVESAGRADAALAELQDSMLPVEVGDQELRASLSSVRELLATVAPAARELLCTLGR